MVNKRYKMAKTDVKESTAYIFSRSFTVSSLTLKSLMHFEMTFVCGVR